MTKAIYEKGRKILSISDFDTCESLWYKWNGKTVHRSVLLSLQYKTLQDAISYDRVFIAKKKGAEQ